MELPACKLMVFQGPPYKDEDFEEAIVELWQVMKKYNPEFYGFKWAGEDGPRFQLAPQGERGYIEARPVRLRLCGISPQSLACCCTLDTHATCMNGTIDLTLDMAN
jgi:hypothetical protein